MTSVFFQVLVPKLRKVTQHGRALLMRQHLAAPLADCAASRCVVSAKVQHSELGNQDSLAAVPFGMKALAHASHHA